MSKYTDKSKYTEKTKTSTKTKTKTKNATNPRDWFANRILRSKNSQHSAYYADINYKWHHDVTDNGIDYLTTIAGEYTKVLNELAPSDDDELDTFLKRGIDIYSKKEELQKKKGKSKSQPAPTWSESEYEDKSFIHTYVRTKLFQRIPETVTMLQQMDLAGRFDMFREKQNKRLKAGKERKPLNILSIGCGPCFELAAVKCYLGGEFDINLFGTDTSDAWEDYASIIARNSDDDNEYVNFFKTAITMDNYNEFVEKAMGGKYPDIIILSYVNISHLSMSYQDISKMLKDSASAMVIERYPTPVNGTEMNGITPKNKNVMFLNQVFTKSDTVDSRFTLISSPNTEITPVSDEQINKFEPLFHSIPFQGNRKN